MENLIEETQKIETLVLKNDNIDDSMYYYNFLKNSNDNRKVFIEIYNCLKKKKIKKKKDFQKFFENDINLNNFEYIKTKKDLSNFILSLIITKNFCNLSLCVKKENDDSFRNFYNWKNDLVNELEKFIIFMEIKKKKNLDLNFIEDIVTDTIFFLISEKIIIQKIYLCKKKKKLNRFLYIENIQYINGNLLSYEKYNIYEKKENYLYLYSYHFSLVSKIYLKNKKSDYYFNTNLNSDWFKNCLEYCFYIDLKRLKIIFKTLLSEYDIKEENLDEEYKEIRNKFIEFIRKKDINSISTISKNMSKLENLIKIKNILNLNIENRLIYEPINLDFRGRLYYNSIISISYYKEFRYCIHLGYYDSLKSKFHPINDTINLEIKKYFFMIDELEKYNFKNKEEDVKISIIWMLISLGEINKNKLGKEVHVSSFIKEGISIINSNLNKFDLYEKIKIEYIMNIFDEINNNIYKKWLISKDATASVYQHLVKTCGSKNDEVLKWCNLNSKDTWYDTYSFILDDFKEKNNIKYKNIFTRKNLKKIMMTENYSASYRTCEKYFLENVDLKLYDEKEKKEIISDFIKFYEYISNNKNMFKIDLEKIFEYFKNHGFILCIKYDNRKDIDIISLIYNEKYKKQREIKFNNERYTYLQWGYRKNKMDIKKIKTSIKANYIHSIDACLVRWAAGQTKIKAVHDCYYIDYINLTYLTSLLNEGMRVRFHQIEDFGEISIFSIFICI